MAVRAKGAAALPILSFLITSSLLLSSFVAEAQFGPNTFQFDIVEATIASIQAAYKAGTLNSTTLCTLYAQRIAALNPLLKAVLEVNPDLLAIAAQKDAERKKAGGYIGGLHGIPILLKDNIATKDKLNTTAGSYALLYSIVPKDANLLVRLRKAGAIIIGKANLSQWANYRSFNSISGWTSRGGFTLDAYNLGLNPSGSSSGSGVGAAASLATLTLGSETDGSIASPSNFNAVVGIKPTIGLVSRAGVIPISHTQDTVGPMCRTMVDAVATLDAIHVTAYDREDTATSRCLKYIPKKGYSQYLTMSGIKGKRLGIPRPFWAVNQTAEYAYLGRQISSYMVPVYEKAIATLKSLGAVIVDNITLPGLEEAWNSNSENTILSFDFKQDLAAYLSKLVYAPSGRTLLDIIKFNQYDPKENISRFDQNIFLEAQNTTGYSSPIYKAAQANETRIVNNIYGIPFKQYELDAIIAPNYFSSFGSFAAKRGYPIISIPVGYAPAVNPENDLVDTPYSLGFYGLACSEAKLISIAYAFEQATKARKPPEFRGTPPAYALVSY